MKIIYENPMILGYLRFEFIGVPKDHVTEVWRVINHSNDFEIGAIRWQGSFRKYAFFPTNDAVFDSTCLRTIAEFLTAMKDIGLPVYNEKCGQYGLVIRAEPRLCNSFVKSCYDVRLVNGTIAHWYMEHCKVVTQ